MFQVFWCISCMLKELYCITEAPLDVLKFELWFIIWNLNFPTESDGACTGLNGHCARKTKVLFLVCCYKAMGDREQDLWRYWLREGCIKKWYDRASGYGCHSNKCLKGDQWSSDLAASRTLAKYCDIQSENTRLKHDYHHWPQSTLT